MTNKTSGAQTKFQSVTKLHQIRDKRIIPLRSSQLGGIEVLKASISVPHALTLQGLAQLILQLLQLTEKLTASDCFLFMCFLIVLAHNRSHIALVAHHHIKGGCFPSAACFHTT